MSTLVDSDSWVDWASHVVSNHWGLETCENCEAELNARLRTPESLRLMMLKRLQERSALLRSCQSTRLAAWRDVSCMHQTDCIECRVFIYGQAFVFASM